MINTPIEPGSANRRKIRELVVTIDKLSSELRQRLTVEEPDQFFDTISKEPSNPKQQPKSTQVKLEDSIAACPIVSSNSLIKKDNCVIVTVRYGGYLRRTGTVLQLNKVTAIVKLDAT